MEGGSCSTVTNTSLTDGLFLQEQKKGHEGLHEIDVHNRVADQDEKKSSPKTTANSAKGGHCCNDHGDDKQQRIFLPSSSIGDSMEGKGSGQKGRLELQGCNMAEGTGSSKGVSVPCYVEHIQEVLIDLSRAFFKKMLFEKLQNSSSGKKSKKKVGPGLQEELDKEEERLWRQAYTYSLLKEGPHGESPVQIISQALTALISFIRLP